MAFNSNLPINDSQVRADELRSQFNSLKSEIDAIVPGVGGNGTAGAIAQWTGGSALGDSTLACLKDRVPNGAPWSCNSLLIPAPSAGGNPLYLDVDSNGNFAFRATSGGIGESLWVSGNDGVWHFQNGITVNGSVTFNNLPTSDPVSAGALWNDSGTLKVSAG